ncbi:MAG: hypothetical protein M3220_19955 [Chloroflexota bacterium]|nr:hypothetical protein [Chloroflexota bacterium]
MRAIEQVKNERSMDPSPLATVTDTRTLRDQQRFLEAWRRLEREREQVTTGAIRASCQAQLRRLDKEIARNNRFLASRGF